MAVAPPALRMCQSRPEGAAQGLHCGSGRWEESLLMDVSPTSILPSATSLFSLFTGVWMCDRHLFCLPGVREKVVLLGDDSS